MRHQLFYVGRTVVRRWWVQLTALLVVFVLLWGAPDSPRAAPSLISPPLYSASMSSGISNEGWQLPSCGSFDTAPYHTVPGVEITFSVSKASMLDLSFAGLGRNSSSGSIYSAFFVDGQKINTAFGHEQLGGHRQGDVGGQWVWHSLANTIALSVGVGRIPSR